jgi:hypothetical protein
VDGTICAEGEETRALRASGGGISHIGDRDRIAMSNRKATDRKSRSMTSDEREDIRIAYQSYPQFIAMETQKQWSATSIFVQLALALIVASFVPEFVLGIKRFSAVVGLVIGVLGVGASFLWFGFNKRSEKIQHFWIVCMREAEEKMTGQIRAVQRGKFFAKGDVVRVSGEDVGYGFMETWPTRVGLNIMYVIFILIFLGLVGLNALKLCGLA